MEEKTEESKPLGEVDIVAGLVSLSPPSQPSSATNSPQTKRPLIEPANKERLRPPLRSQKSLPIPSEKGQISEQKSLPETGSPPAVAVPKKANSDSSLHGDKASVISGRPPSQGAGSRFVLSPKSPQHDAAKPPIGSPPRVPVSMSRASSKTSIKARPSSLTKRHRTVSDSSRGPSRTSSIGSYREFLRESSLDIPDDRRSATTWQDDVFSESEFEGPVMSTPKQSFRDLQHPSLEPILKQHNALSLRLLLTVADFAQKVAAAHESFSSQLHSVVSQFRRVSLELMKERPVEYHSSLHLAWDTLLHETEMDAQSQADTASLLIKNVYDPLVEVVQHKKSHQKKLYGFREQFDAELTKSNEVLNKVHAEYVESYHRYRLNSRDQTRNLTCYFDSHNDYVLQLGATNRMQDEYHNNALPFILEELEEIHIDTSNVLNGAMESHALLLVTKATEQTNRFEEILKVCKQVNPKGDVINFVRSVNPDPDTDEPPANIFKCPEIGSNGEAILKNEIITDRLTETQLKQKRADLQKEAAELTSYIKQNQDVTQTLINICQRNLANHLYSKVYETQEDLCRKRNEIRMATIQLAAIRSQIDLLTPKQNGTMQATESDKKSAQTIKGMWKKAFKSLKQKKPGDPAQPSSKAVSPDVEEAGGRRSFLKRKDSKDQPESDQIPEPAEIDPVYSLLKCASEIPKGGKHCHSAQCGLAGSKCLHLGTMGQTDNLQVRSSTSSRSSSPSSMSQSPTRRRKMLSLRMKSFSLDAPDSPKQLEDNPPIKTPISPEGRRKRFGKRASSLEISSSKDGERFGTLQRMGSRTSSFRDSCHNSPNISPSSQRRYIPSKLYVAMYNYKGKEKDDLDLRAGWRLSVTDTTDTDWWRGQCNGKTGYFPASYVQKLYPGNKVMMVTQTLQLTEGENGIKLCRDQVVLQTGNEVDGTVPVKTGSGRKVYCRTKHLMEV